MHGARGMCAKKSLDERFSFFFFTKYILYKRVSDVVIIWTTALVVVLQWVNLLSHVQLGSIVYEKLI